MHGQAPNPSWWSSGRLHHRRIWIAETFGKSRSLVFQVVATVGRASGQWSTEALSGGHVAKFRRNRMPKRSVLKMFDWKAVTKYRRNACETFSSLLLFNWIPTLKICKWIAIPLIIIESQGLRERWIVVLAFGLTTIRWRFAIYNHSGCRQLVSIKLMIKI